MDQRRLDGYEPPQVRDYGSLVMLTAHKGGTAAEDGCGKTDDGAICPPSEPAGP